MRSALPPHEVDHERNRSKAKHKAQQLINEVECCLFSERSIDHSLLRRKRDFAGEPLSNGDYRSDSRSAECKGEHDAELPAQLVL